MHSKKVFLTIDDGPSKDRIAKVNFLYEKGIQAVWFCTGLGMEERPDETIYTIRKGGIIGNHSFSHPHFSEIPLEQCFQEIVRTDRLIDKLYQKAGVNRPFKAFRFPYGDKGGGHRFFGQPYSLSGKTKNNKIQTFLRDLNYSPPWFANITYAYYRDWGFLNDRDWYWTYDVTEWSIFQEKPLFGIETLDDVMELMEMDLPEKWAGLNYPDSDDIIVIHDHPQTTAYFGPIVERLLAKKMIFGKIYPNDIVY